MKHAKINLKDISDVMDNIMFNIMPRHDLFAILSNQFNNAVLIWHNNRAQEVTKIMSNVPGVLYDIPTRALSVTHTGFYTRNYFASPEEEDTFKEWNFFVSTVGIIMNILKAVQEKECSQSREDTPLSITLLST